eukprot:scaffold29622_cov67-Phaeocystis_antarctica.AAC.1
MYFLGGGTDSNCNPNPNPNFDPNITLLKLTLSAVRWQLQQNPRFRLRHTRRLLHLLQHLPDQHGPAVREGRPVGRVPLWREGLHHPQPGEQEPVGVVGLRWHVPAKLSIAHRSPDG